MTSLPYSLTAPNIEQIELIQGNSYGNDLAASAGAITAGCPRSLHCHLLLWHQVRKITFVSIGYLHCSVFAIPPAVAQGIWIF
ncbi:hypothetical protein BGX24_004240 [Mortierella sp. AD032]|nr:hypothetical protein BGX24_004240 [Mortierella sp. AD032]